MKPICSKALWIVVLLCTAFARPTYPAPGKNVKKLAEDYNDFAFGLFARLTKEHPNENVFISPTSAAVALAMMRQGAKGQTERELMDVLHATNLGATNFSIANTELLNDLTQSNPSAILEVANSIWASRDATIKQEFTSQLNRAFGASARNANLTDPQTILEMNQWVSSKTHGKISGIADRPFDPGTKMVLLDAVYFKGTWERKFNPALAQNRQFFPGAKQGVDRPFMVQNGGFSYVDFDSVQGVYLPYVGEKIGMYIFLPHKSLTSASMLFPDGHEVFANASNKKETAHFAEFFRDLNAQNWKDWTSRLGYHEGTLELPKFKLNLSFDLKKPLMDLGMKSAFSAGADFSGISDEPTCIGELKQQTFVEINEEGTEAAAVTKVVTDGFGVPETFLMVVNSPFFVAIVDQQTQAIIFMGVIYDPS